MSDDILTRIKALIARTASSSEEEARTSAVIACRLIRDHKIELIHPDSLNQDPGSPEDFDGPIGEDLETALQSVWDFMSHGGRRRRNTNAQAQARAHASAFRPEAPRRRYPFNPMTAPFSVVRAYVKAHGIDVHDNGDGSFSASATVFGSYRGPWPETVRFMFGVIENGYRPR